MKEKQDLWWTKWASILTVVIIPVGAIYVAGHKDQQLFDLQQRFETQAEHDKSIEKRIEAMRELLDKILLKQQGS